MRTIVPALLLGSLVFVMILYLNASHSYLLDDAKYALTGNDAMASLDANNARQLELRRTQRINALLISDKNKRDLRKGRPFWGAAQHMLELAFGVPADNAVVRVKGETVYEFHTYNLAPEVIVFEFQNNKLACAHYASNQRGVCDTYYDSYYGTNSAALFRASASQVTQRQ